MQVCRTTKQSSHFAIVCPSTRLPSIVDGREGKRRASPAHVGDEVGPSKERFVQEDGAVDRGGIDCLVAWKGHTAAYRGCDVVFKDVCTLCKRRRASSGRL